MSYDYTEDIYRATEKVREDNPRPTILVCGYTGSGKTTLIQKIFGKDIVPDNRISHGEPCTKDFDFYQNDFFRLYDSKGLEPGNKGEEEFLTSAKRLVTTLREDKNIDNHIHLVWYCIQGSGARVTDCDLRLIKEVFDLDHELIVVTKRDITRDIQYETILEKLTPNGIPSERIMPVSDLDDELLNALLEKSINLLPAARRKAFIAAQVLRLDKKKKAAQAIIHSNAAAAAAIGAIPIPGSDAPILAGLQTEMLVALAFNYGFAGESVKAAFLPVIAKSVGVLAASSLVKLIPGLGSVIQAAVAAALTDAVGLTGNAYFIRCAEAKLRGEPMPEFKFDPSKFEHDYKSSKKRH